MSEQTRAILEDVAAGRLSPEEAAARIAAVQDEARATDKTAAGSGPRSDDDAPGRASDRDRAQSREREPQDRPVGVLSTVRVRGGVGTVTVIGDPTVREAVADGAHEVVYEDGEPVIEIKGFGDFEGFGGSGGFSGFSFSRSDFRRAGIENGLRPVTVRMNPDLALEVELHVGRLVVRHVRGPIRADVQAGPIKVEGFAGPIELSAQAGTISAKGRLDRGESRVECQAGAVHVHLEPGSSVRVSASASLGQVRLPGEGSAARQAGKGWMFDSSAREMTIGDGAGSLEAHASMGAVHISTTDDDIADFDR